MTSELSIGFAHSAVADLEEVQAWYRRLDAPEVGARVIAGIIAQIERLSEFPESGRVVPEFDVPSLREIIDPPFRIVYRLQAERVLIVRIRRSERLMDLT